MKKTRKQQARKRSALLAVLYVATAIVLAMAPWAASSVQAADQRSSSGSSRPLMPGNQPAGTGLNQPVPGSTMGPNGQRPGTPAPPAGTGVPPTSKVPSGAPSSSMPGQGTVSGSKGAPGSIGDPAGGTAGSRGAKDNQLGR